ncbi:tRNA pseudouridine synthase 1 [Tulasnella sp. 331]|nr:tRNA pseudouridine synthase 1 [Tulasnella sp. 331]
MQFQKTGEATIEGYLFDALIKSGAISKDNSDEPSKVGMQRAARTDAGVHAATNLVSLKMITEPPIHDSFQPESLSSSIKAATTDGDTAMQHSVPPSTQRVVAWINSFLPPQIRILSFVRTRGSFHGRKGCDSRRYEYLFPSWMLLPPKPGSGLANMMERAQVEAGLPSPIATHEFWTVPPPDTATTAKDVILSDLTRKRSWRVGPETLATFCAHMAEFKGTHCFHNYTVGREFSDRQTQRFMMALDVRDPKVLDDGTEWISVSVHGQSFMLHQRKMISMAILACRTGTPTRLIPETFGPRRINVPMAPALGLLLEQPVFQTYNEIVTRENAALLLRPNLTPEDVAAKVRPPIEFEAHQQQIDAFKVRYIYERMREEEQEKSMRVFCFDRWLRYIDSYDGDDLLYLNPKGLILPAAVFGKKGERRVKLLRDWIYERRPEKKSGLQTSEQDEDAEGEDEDAEFAGLKSKDLEEMEG